MIRTHLASNVRLAKLDLEAAQIHHAAAGTLATHEAMQVAEDALQDANAALRDFDLADTSAAAAFGGIARTAVEE